MPSFTLDLFGDLSEAELRVKCREMSRRSVRYSTCLLGIATEDITAEQMRDAAERALWPDGKPAHLANWKLSD